MQGHAKTDQRLDQIMRDSSRIPRRSLRKDEPVAACEISRLRLCRSYLSGRLDRQLQDFAKRRQVRISWPSAIRLPKIDACGGHADLFGNFNDR